MTPSEQLLSVCTAEPLGMDLLASRVDPQAHTSLDTWRRRMPGLVRAGWVTKGQIKRVSVYSITPAGVRHLDELRAGQEAA